MQRAFISTAVCFAAITLILISAGCSLEKKSTVNRGLQNLTAHYNILFNANDLLRQKQDVYATDYIDNYNELLSVYQDTATNTTATDKELDAVIEKANKIISTKEQSHYIGNAYLLLGQANHLYGKYFNSVEFLKYTIASFSKQTGLVQEARVWEVRSLLHLNQLPEAKQVLDSALQNADSKKNITAQVYAAALQYYINTTQYMQAEDAAAKAVKLTSSKRERLRWTFIMAQLQELNNEPDKAYASYMRVVKSNASFEMAFNADLNRIRLEDNRQNIALTRMERLKRLLRDDKNIEFTDQIYYQMALLALADDKIDDALKYLNLSVRHSQKNQNQKGLSYLRMADIYFKNKTNYVTAKKYYDSTLLNLSPTYPNYTYIRKKSDNLQLLADGLQTIAREDTLQLLARLDDKARNAKLDELVASHQQQVQAEAQAAASNAFQDPFNNNTATINGKTNTASTFYFYNTGAISQGFGDFKRRWGNRKLEDNWRRSKRPGSDVAVNALNTAAQNTDPDALPGQDQKNTQQVTNDNYRQTLLQNIPLNATLMAQSNLRVYNAYMDIANFYRDILNDKQEAIAVYETVLKRFPDDQNKAMIYYNLYRLYSETNPARADEYKNIILKNYASSIYARVIIDPDYSRRLNDKNAEFDALYNQVYDLLAQRKYTDVTGKADTLLRQFPDNHLAPQLAYLRTIASGHHEKLAPFRTELLQITEKYPGDKLVTPLINQHIVYIDEHKTELEKREFALLDNDPNEEPFIPPVVQPEHTAARHAVAQNTYKQAPVQQPKVGVPAQTITPPVTAPIDTAAAAKTITPKAPSIYSLRDSTHLYFVVNVSTGTANLASSRFGIGQFNRTNYANAGIKHQLKDAGADNQLIYVGIFNNVAAAKDYARAIIPLMSQIMKVPADKYSFFIITQENLNKLADKKTLDSYIDFYQNNYLK